MVNDDFFLPIAIRLDDAAVLVVGGGEIATHKFRLLISRAARITVLAPTVTEAIAEHADGSRVIWIRSEATDAMLTAHVSDKRIIFAATDDALTNRRVTAAARARNIPVCAVDDPAPSTFITPAIIDRRPVQIAITTGGAAPVLARRLRLAIETLLPAGLGHLAQFMRRQRSDMRVRMPDVATRRRVWEAFLDGPGKEAALAGLDDEALEALHAATETSDRAGEVWLVGAGPGDPDMLTLGALRLMQNADSILYDHLIPETILDRVRRDAERVFVGKKRGHHALPQNEINAEMIRRAKAGERVLRLKGGDPFIFGRGGEEMEAAMAAGLTVRVLPGITAASGCGAIARIPLTHRDHARSCIFLTGHARADGSLDLAWPALVRRDQTLVIYMGLAPLPELCARLIEHGLPPDWPAAIIEHGTRPDQKVHVGTLASLAHLAATRNITSPALTIIGKVVLHRGTNQNTD